MARDNSDLWAEEILAAVNEAENGTETETISFEETRYFDAYEESLLSYVY